MKLVSFAIVPLLLLSLLAGTAQATALSLAAGCDQCDRPAQLSSCCSEERQPDELHRHAGSPVDPSPCAHGGWCRDDNTVPPAMVSVVSVDISCSLDSLAGLYRHAPVGHVGTRAPLTLPASGDLQLYLLNCSFLI